MTENPIKVKVNKMELFSLLTDSRIDLECKYRDTKDINRIQMCCIPLFHLAHFSWWSSILLVEWWLPDDPRDFSFHISSKHKRIFFSRHFNGPIYFLVRNLGELPIVKKTMSWKMWCNPCGHGGGNSIAQSKLRLCENLQSSAGGKKNNVKQ